MNTKERIDHIEAHAARLAGLIREGFPESHAADKLAEDVAAVAGRVVAALRRRQEASASGRRPKRRGTRRLAVPRSLRDVGGSHAYEDVDPGEPDVPSPSPQVRRQPDDPLSRPLAPDPSLDQPIPMTDAEYKRINAVVSKAAVKKALVPRYKNVHPKQECPICMGTVDSHPIDQNIVNEHGVPFLRKVCGDVYVCDGTPYVAPVGRTATELGLDADA